MAGYSVTPQELQACASQLQSGASQIEQINHQLEAQVNSVAGAWTGTAHERFQQVYAEWQTSQRNLQQSLAQLATMVQKASTAYADTESQVASSFHQ